MSWIEDLTAKIEALTDEDFERDYIVSVGMGFPMKNPDIAKIKVRLDVPYCPRRALMDAIGCVNSGPIGLAGRGCVLIEGFTSEGMRTEIHVSVRRVTPWNSGMIIDAAGRKPYREIDFSTLPDSPPSTRPG